MLFQVISS